MIGASALTAMMAAPHPACPPGTTLVDTFAAEARVWSACEDLRLPGGGLTLIPSTGEAVHLPKTYEPYSPKPDSEYYLGLGKQRVLDAKWDMLGDAILTACATRTPTTRLCEPTWARVEAAVPVMRYSRGNKQASGNQFMCSPYSPESGVRTFTGSRSASVDATFSDHADDCTDNGFPRPQGYVMNLTAIAHGEPPVHRWFEYVNFTGMADGLVGKPYPNLIFYFPILTQNFSSFGGSRYWTMIASPVPDMDGGREQSVWFRFQQLRCAGPRFEPPCEVYGSPQYYDTYWFTNSPITTRWIRPELRANASGFYSNLLRVKRYWDAELAAEGMMRLALPDTPHTNGSWLHDQALFSVVRSMISRDDSWHPRYGVLPGYGVTLQDGFQDTFTSTATAALEWGAEAYAAGVLDNWLRYYVRADGMITYRAEELAQSGRMLSIFALYVSYTADTKLVLTHFGKARALAEWLLYRFNMALADHADPSDPRHGIIAGGDEGDTFVHYYESYGNMSLPHKYSTHANVYRGFEDVGRMWMAVGTAAGRDDVLEHAAELLDAAPKMLATLRASLNKTIRATGRPRAPLCVPTGADPPNTRVGGVPPLPESCAGDFRGYPELMYSGALTREQADALFTHLMYGNDSASGTRPMTLGCTGYNAKQFPSKPEALPSWQSTYTAYGMAYGLLVHDMVERFLLHYFGMSAHTYTRGTWTTPEATHPDRDIGSTDYVAAGVHTAPTYLKWMLVFEEPNTRTVWLAKALPREWLDVQYAQPVVVTDSPTRYGRVSYSLHAEMRAAYTVVANVSLPHTYCGDTGPPGGLRLRLRAPVAHVGKLAAVSVGGKAWRTFNAKMETIDFPPKCLSRALIGSGLGDIVATWT